MRRSNRCEYAHTPLSPHKTRVRGNWLRAIPVTKDLICVSHALCDALELLGWQGRIALCDIDPGVRQQIKFSRRGSRGKAGADYPNRNLLPPGRKIEDTVRAYCEQYGTHDLGAVDVDLTFCIEGCLPILQDVLTTLLEFKACGTKVLLTFRNGRDCGFDSLDERIAWLKSQLPKGVRYDYHEAYNSLGIGKNVERSKGSPMCIVALSMG